MATIEDAENTNKMILALSDMFKYSSEISVKVVSLKEELSNMESYLYIQSIRYEDNFVYHVDVKDELLNCAVPKLILQPLVENCFKHGFGKRKAEKNSGQNEIIVCAVKENERLKVHVMDNGAGMTDKRLKEIQESLNGADTERKHDNGSTEIGLSNVNKRLKLFYGEEYGVSVSCKRGNYTCVEITLMYAEINDEMNGELRKHF